MYEPREDSFLIQKHIKEFCSQNSIVLDMGTGSGLLAFEASKYSKNVTAVDIDPETISLLRSKLKSNNSSTCSNNTYTSSEARRVKFLQSNLFSKIPKNSKFNLIIFNPPYIPTEKIKYIDLDGGKNGTEIIEPFLKQAKQFLKRDGKILLLTSSLTKDIESLFKKYNYTYQKIDQEKFAFEELFLWVLN